MNKKWKKITFVVLDVVVLGFFGFYLALNLKYENDEVKSSDFAMKVLANDSSSDDSGSSSSTNNCTGYDQYQKPDGTCDTCGTGRSPNYNHTGCNCDSVSAPTLKKCGTISKNGDNPTNCDVSDEEDVTCTTGSPYVSVSGVTVTAGDVSSTNCKVNATISCRKKSPAPSAYNCSDSPASTTTVTVMVPWNTTSKEERVYYGGVVSQSEAEKDNYNKYHKAGCNPPEGGSEMCTIVVRGCGSEPPKPQPACYKENSTGFLKWDYDYLNSSKSFQSYNTSTGKWEAKSGYTKTTIQQEDCYTQFKCSTTYPGKDEKEASCNSTSEFTGSYVKKCGIKNGDSIGDEFYRIDCKETMKTGFNGPILNDSSKPNSFMYPGTAFKFNYIAKTKIECEGKWHQDFYTKAESYVKDYIDKKKFKSFHQEDSGFFDSALAGVQNVKESYRNWTLNYFNSSFSKETGVIKDQQPTVKGTSKDEKEFTLEMADGSKTKVSSCGNEPNGKNENFTYKVAYTIKMQMPVVYYSDSQKPQYTTVATSGYTSIGRVFPISDIKEYAKRTDYKYNVTISNLGLGHKWVNKETCALGVKEKEIVFRSINLNDPFIQALDSNHEIGENWKNSKYDFTGIIDKNTWSNPSQFNTVTIDQQIGKLIKNELARQYSSYLGSCAKGTDQGKTPQLCALYKQAVAGK